MIEPNANSFKVLWVDDDLHHVSQFRHQLAANDIKVVHASTVDEAVKMLKNGKFSAIVLDLMMDPGDLLRSETDGGFDTGLKLLEYIDKNRLRDNAKVIIYTASRMPEYETRAADLGAEYVSKSFGFDKINIVEKLVGSYDRTNQ